MQRAEERLLHLLLWHLDNLGLTIYGFLFSTPVNGNITTTYMASYTMLAELYNYETVIIIQSDPDLTAPSGERVLSVKSGYPLNRGQILLISCVGGR